MPSSSLTEPLLESNQNDESHLNNPSPDETRQPTHTKPTKSKNINLILFYTFFTYSARSLWNQSVLSAYIYLLKSDDPKFVGLMTAIMGIAQLLTSFPSGILADRYRRDTMLKIGSIVGLIAASCTFTASRMNNFVLLGSALAVWGLFWGIVNTCVSALLADSIQDGDRSHFFTQRMILQLLGNTFGPCVALVLFSKLGNDWTADACSVVIAAGQFLVLPALGFLFLMNDDYTVMAGTGEAAGTTEHSDSESSADNAVDVESGSDDAEQARDELVPLNNNIEESVLHEDVHQDNDAGSIQSNYLCIPSNRVVPVFIASADVLGGLAAGMSVRYFPIFFLENLKLSPSQVQIVFISTMISMAVMGRFVQRISKKFGRVQTAATCKWIGITFLVAMISAYRSGLPSYIVCILYVLRTSFMNSPGALTRSILMDHVPKQERAKWISLESVNMFSWSGSAAVGGFLVDMEGIIFNFYVTAGLQLVATIPLFLAFGKVQRALTRSILMDHVPKQERAKWISLESVNMFLWSGSKYFQILCHCWFALVAKIPLFLAFGKVRRGN